MSKSKAAILAGTFVVLITTYPARAADAPAQSVAKQLAMIRHEQAVAWAKQDGVELPASAQEFFRAAQRGTWAPLHAPFRSVLAERPLKSAWLFHLIHDVYGAYEQDDMWHPDLLDQFAGDVLRGIPDGSIYFGGTSPGRFTITAWVASHRQGDVFVLTQKALVDERYLEYLARIYPSGISLPSGKGLAKGGRMKALIRLVVVTCAVVMCNLIVAAGGPSSKPAASPLRTAVLRFNRQALEHPVGRLQPPLAEEEVVAAIRFHAWDKEVDPEVQAIFEKIAEARCR